MSQTFSKSIRPRRRDDLSAAPLTTALPPLNTATTTDFTNTTDSSDFSPERERRETPSAAETQRRSGLDPLARASELQATLGNAAVSRAAMQTPAPSLVNIGDLQTNYGNAALAREPGARQLSPVAGPGTTTPTPAPAAPTGAHGSTVQESVAAEGRAEERGAEEVTEEERRDEELRRAEGPVPRSDRSPAHQTVPPPTALEQSPISAEDETKDTASKLPEAATGAAPSAEAGTEAETAAPAASAGEETSEAPAAEEAAGETASGGPAPSEGEAGGEAGSEAGGEAGAAEAAAGAAPVAPVVEIVTVAAPEGEQIGEEGYSPEQARAEAQARLQVFINSVATRHAAIAAETAAAQDAVNAIFDEHIAAAQAAAAASLATIQSLFAEARSNASSAIAAAREQIHAIAEQHMADFQAFCDERRGAIETSASDHVTRIQTANDSHDQRVREAVQEQVQRGTDGTQQQAQSARQAGSTRASQLSDADPDLRAAKAEADITVANDTASKLEEKIPELQDSANEIIEPVLGKFNEEAGSLPQTINEQVAGLIGRFPELVTNEQTSTTALLAQADTDLAAAEASIMSSLDQGEATLTASVEAALASNIEQIESNRATVIQQIGDYGLAADENLTLFEQTVTGAVLAEEEPYVPGIESALESADASSEELMTRFRDGLAGIIEEVRSDAAEASASFAEQLDAASASVAGSIQQTQATQDEMLASTTERMVAELEARRAAADSKLTESIGAINAQFEELTVNFEQAVDSSVNETRTQAAAAVDEVLLSNQQNVQALWGMSPDGKFEEAEGNVQKSWWDYFLEGFNVLMFVVGLLVLLVIVVIAVVISAKAALIVGLIVLAIGAVMVVYSRIKSLIDSDAPWWKWVIYFVALPFLLPLDIVGIGPLIEAAIGYDLVTFEELSTAERWRRFGAGVSAVLLTLISLGVGKYVMPRIAPRGGRGRPPRIPPGEEPPPRERPPVPIIDPWVALGEKFGLRAEVVEILRNSGIEITIFDRILGRGVNGDTVGLITDVHGRFGVRILDKLSAAGIRTEDILRVIDDADRLGHLEKAADLAERGVLERLMKKGFDSTELVLLIDELGTKGVETIDALIKNGVQRNPAIESARLAKQIGAVDEVHNLSTGGNLENPQGLRNFLREIAAELAVNNRGKLTQLQEASRRSAGGRVAIESSDVGKADIIDHARQEALQMKVVSSADSRAPASNTNAAAKQLRGEGGEVPPPGYKRIADIRITNERNPQFPLDRAQLLQDLKSNGVTQASLAGVDQVHVTNGTGTHVYTPNEF